MIDEFLFVHRVLVYIFLAFLVSGLLIPFAIKDALKFKKASLTYTMTFQGIATMVAFAGLVLLYAGHMSWDIFSASMVLVWALMMFIEIKKYRLIKYANLTHQDTFDLLKSGFNKISILQIVILLMMIGVMFLKNSGAISV
jgi:hypothetical protein